MWIAKSKQRKAKVRPTHASAARSAVGHPAKKTDGFAPAGMNATHSILEAPALPASTSGLRLSVYLVAAGHRIRIGTRSNVTSGSKLHNAAKGETTECARANRRVSDSQTTGRSNAATSTTENFFRRASAMSASNPGRLALSPETPQSRYSPTTS